MVNEIHNIWSTKYDNVSFNLVCNLLTDSRAFFTVYKAPSKSKKTRNESILYLQKFVNVNGH